MASNPNALISYSATLNGRWQTRLGVHAKLHRITPVFQPSRLAQEGSLAPAAIFGPATHTVSPGFTKITRMHAGDCGSSPAVKSRLWRGLP